MTSLQRKLEYGVLNGHEQLKTLKCFFGQYVPPEKKILRVFENSGEEDILI
jgi:hypothetical protein